MTKCFRHDLAEAGLQIAHCRADLFCEVEILNSVDSARNELVLRKYTFEVV